MGPTREVGKTSLLLLKANRAHTCCGRSMLLRATGRCDPPSDATFNRDLLDEPNWQADSESADQLREPLLRLCAHYLVNEWRGASALDPVAAFHLGNGASVERINWLADTSEKGLKESAGLMVNYLYQPSRIERNHEVYVNRGRIAKSPKVGLLLRKK